MTARSLARPLASQLAKPLTVAGSSGGGAPLILDTYSALGGWGLSKRKNAATSPFRVRESAGSTEQDAAFSDNALNTTSLLAFTGANSGFVVSAYDQTGNSKHAAQSTTTLQPRIVNSGVADDGFVFDGSNYYLESPTLGSFSAASTFTIMAWVKFASLPGAVRKTALANIQITNDFEFDIASSAVTANRLCVIAGKAGVASQEAAHTVDFAANTWYHVAGVFNGTTVAIFVNGVASTTATLNATTIGATANSKGVTLGVIRYTGASFNGFAGSVRDAFVFGSALSEANILAIKTATE